MTASDIKKYGTGIIDARHIIKAALERRGVTDPQVAIHFIALMSEQGLSLCLTLERIFQKYPTRPEAETDARFMEQGRGLIAARRERVNEQREAAA